MKTLYTFLICALMAGNVGAQGNLLFSYTTDLTDPSMIQVDIFARSNAADENLTGYTSVFYYNSAEADYVSYDEAPAQAIGWDTNGNFTVTNNEGGASNAGVPSTHDSRLELQQFDGNFAGSIISGVAVPVGRLVFSRTTAGDPAEGGDLFLSNTVVDPGIQYVDNNFSGFNIFTEGAAQQGLPIVLSDFDVVRKGDDTAALNWVTSSEENASHFDVERSIDGKEWSKIGSVNATGNSSTEQYYQFDDSNLKAIPNDDKVFYYRLRAVDFDSQFDYSAVKNIQLEYGDIAVSLYPNPTSSGIWVRMSHPRESREELSYTLIDISGKIVLANTLGNAKEINEYIQLSDKISNGTYMLNISTPTQNLLTERVVVVGQK